MYMNMIAYMGVSLMAIAIPPGAYAANKDNALSKSENSGWGAECQRFPPQHRNHCTHRRRKCRKCGHDYSRQNCECVYT